MHAALSCFQRHVLVAGPDALRVLLWGGMRHNEHQIQLDTTYFLSWDPPPPALQSHGGELWNEPLSLAFLVLGIVLCGGLVLDYASHRYKIRACARLCKPFMSRGVVVPESTPGPSSSELSGGGALSDTYFLGVIQAVTGCAVTMSLVALASASISVTSFHEKTTATPSVVGIAVASLAGWNVFVGFALVCLSLKGWRVSWSTHAGFFFRWAIACVSPAALAFAIECSVRDAAEDDSLQFSTLEAMRVNDVSGGFDSVFDTFNWKRLIALETARKHSAASSIVLVNMPIIAVIISALSYGEPHTFLLGVALSCSLVSSAVDAVSILHAFTALSLLARGKEFSTLLDTEIMGSRLISLPVQDG